MTVTLKVNTSAVSGLELKAKIETLGDVARFGGKVEKWLRGVLRVNRAWKDAKITGITLGKE